MRVQDITLLFDYNYWANARILTAAARVSAEQYAAPAGFSYGGLRGTLVHTLDAEYSWRDRCQNNTWPEELTEAALPDLPSLRARWAAEEAAMRAYLGTLNDAGLDRVLRYEVEGGIVRERVLWHCLVHAVNHGTQHRSEAAVLLTNYQQSPGDLDFTVFLNSLKP